MLSKNARQYKCREIISARVSDKNELGEILYQFQAPRLFRRLSLSLEFFQSVIASDCILLVASPVCLSFYFIIVITDLIAPPPDLMATSRH